MKKILFVCHGNICRSPMAEFIMKDILKRNELDGMFHIESAATSTEELGNDIYYLAKEKLREKKIPFTKRGARQIRKEDYDNYDYIVGMDEANRRNMLRIMGGDPDNKVSLLLDYTDRPKSISDPWYNRDFETTYREIVKGIEAFLKRISKNN